MRIVVRELRRLLVAPFDARHWRALGRMCLTFEGPLAKSDDERDGTTSEAPGSPISSRQRFTGRHCLIVPKFSRVLRVLADVLESEGARHLVRSRSWAPLSEELAFIKAMSCGHVRP